MSFLWHLFGKIFFQASKTGNACLLPNHYSVERDRSSVPNRFCHPIQFFSVLPKFPIFLGKIGGIDSRDYFCKGDRMNQDKKQIREERISSTLRKVIELFESGNVPQAIAIATFPPYDVPSSRWSLPNRIIMMLSHTQDSRGWKQWQEVGRKVKIGRASCRERV